jgi:hypothetical protein
MLLTPIKTYIALDQERRSINRVPEGDFNPHSSRHHGFDQSIRST